MLQARSDRGLLRERNEDAAAALALPDGSLLLAVADGLGGHAGGAVASRTALDALVERLLAQPPADPAAGLRDAFEAANRAVRARRQGAHARMGTTLVAALVRGARAWTANVGDSRAYLVPLAGGAARRLTEDHSWVEEQIRAGLLEPDDLLAALNRHVITRATGSSPSTTPGASPPRPGRLSGTSGSSPGPATTGSGRPPPSCTARARWRSSTRGSTEPDPGCGGLSVGRRTLNEPRRLHHVQTFG